MASANRLSDDMRREQAGNPQIERNRQRARPHTRRMRRSRNTSSWRADTRGSRTGWRAARAAPRGRADTARWAGCRAFPARGDRAGRPRSPGRRIIGRSSQRGRAACRPAKQSCTAAQPGIRQSRKVITSFSCHQPGQAPDQRVGDLRAEERKDEPRAEVPDEVLDRP